MIESLAYEVIQERKENDYLKTENEILRIKTAKYKALFFGKYDLAERLDKQVTENRDSLIGEFNGFCYCSWRAKAVFRTLENMYDEGIITESEYNFCDEQF